MKVSALIFEKFLWRIIMSNGTFSMDGKKGSAKARKQKTPSFFEGGHQPLFAAAMDQIEENARAESARRRATQRVATPSKPEPGQK
jgi:hypothetical protein